MKRLLLGILVAFGAMCAWCEGGMSEDTVVSNRIRLEGRTSVGGRLLNGNERISPVAERANPNAKLTIDGTVASGWRVAEPEFDSTTLTDGWKTFALNEGASTAEVELLALNNPAVAIHGGALEADETWSSDRIHIVRNWVRIPEDMTLTIEEGTIVKFCEATGIQNDGTLIATGATFTSIEDDSVGGDTDMNGENGALAYGVYFFTGSGKRVMTDCDVRYSANLPVSTRWAAGSVNHIYGTLTVGSGVTLTIEPGAIVKLATNAELTAENGGSIVANGVLFTHIADDSEEAGGDTNGDGDATVPVHDAYKLTGFTPAADCELRYITLTFAGGTISDTMTLEGNRVHKVTGDITVASGGKLIVQPGAIVKMEAGLSITIQSGGTLEAIGNRAQTIVFTSIKDDVHGGDTNGDESKTIPQPGDWRQISVLGGTLNLAFNQIYYCGIGSSMNDAIYMSSGEATLNGCIIAHVTQYVAGLDGGTWMMRNSMFYDFDTAFRHFGSNSNINCVFYDFGNLTNNGSMSFTNCVIAKYSKALLWTSWGNESSDSSSYKNCVIWNPAGFGPQSSVKANSNGNIWADPLFTDPDNGDFTLKAGSPCIDAGDGGVAPEKDYWGKPRMDVVKVADSGKPDADGVCPDIGIFEMPGSYTGCCANLAVNAVTGPAEASSGERFTINWTVTNEGNAEAVGPWRDVIFLQGADEALGGQVVELGEYTVTGTLEPLASREVTAQFTLPPLKPGNWRIGITTNSYRDVYEVKRTDNQAFSEETLEVALPVWSADNNRFAVPARGELGFALEASEEARIVTIAVPEGATMEAFATAGYLPSAESSDATAVSLSDGRLLLTVPATETASYITLTNGGETAATATVSVAALELSLLEAMPAQILNHGNATIRIIGTGLSKESVFTLNMGAATVTGETIALENGLVASVQFTVDGIAPGEYTLSVAESGKTSVLAGKITVTADGVGPKLEAWLETPANVRDGRICTAWLCYKNSGDADMIMPLFEVSCNASTKISYTVDGEYESRPLRYAGISPTAPAGVLKAGDEHRLPIFFTLVGRYELVLKMIDGNAAYEYPMELPDFQRYQSAISEMATRLCLRGREEYELAVLQEYALRLARSMPIASVSGKIFNKILGNPLVGVTVMADNVTGDYAECVTDANGYFLLSPLSDGEYQLQVKESWNADAMTVKVCNGEDVSGYNVYAIPKVVVSGYVMNDELGEYLQGCTVGLLVQGASEPNFQATTDDDGYFRIDGVVPGEYCLAVKSTGYYIGDAVDVTLLEGEEEHSEVLTMVLGGVVTGKVRVKKEEETLPPGIVSAYSEDGIVMEAEIDSDGAYRIAGVYPGVYRFSFSSSNDEHYSCVDLETLEVKAGEMVEKDLVIEKSEWFYTYDRLGIVPMSVTFALLEEKLPKDAVKFEWDFNGDGIIDSIERTPTFVYDTIGDYTVSLTIVDGNGNSGTQRIVDCVKVREPVETVYNANVMKLEEENDLVFEEVNDDSLVVSGNPSSPFEAGVVLFGVVNGNQGVMRVITEVTVKNGKWVLATSNASLMDVFESCYIKAPLCLARTDFTGTSETRGDDTTSEKKDFKKRVEFILKPFSIKGHVDVAMKMPEFDAVEGSFSIYHTILKTEVSMDFTMKNSLVISPQIEITAKIPLQPLPIERVHLGYWNLFFMAGDVPVYVSAAAYFDLNASVSAEIALKYQQSFLINATSTFHTGIDIIHVPFFCMPVFEDKGTVFDIRRNNNGCPFIAQRLDVDGKANFNMDASATLRLALYEVLDCCLSNHLEVKLSAEMGTSSPTTIDISAGQYRNIKVGAIDMDYWGERLSSTWKKVSKGDDDWISKALKWFRSLKLIDTNFKFPSNKLHWEAKYKAPEPDYTVLPESGDTPLKVDFTSVSKTGYVTGVFHDGLKAGFDFNYFEYMMTAVADAVNWLNWQNFELESIKVLDKDVWDKYPDGRYDDQKDPYPIIKAYNWNLTGFWSGISNEGFVKTTENNISHTYTEEGYVTTALRLSVEPIPSFMVKSKTIGIGDVPPLPVGNEIIDQTGGTSQQSCDPNEIAGLVGYGDNATQRFVKPGEWVDYTVYFENKSTAAAAAQEVTVTQQLSEYLDWGTLELGQIAFNNQIQLELKGKKRGTATVNQNGATYQVKMTASLDEATGKFELYLRSYDKTRQAYGYWPESVYAGFLPPNDDTHAGEGHFTFRVKVREGAPDGVMIPAEATIVFDKNAPITTSPAWFNWVNADETLAETGVLTWDSVEGASYEVSIWSGDADVSSDDAVATANSGLLAESRWRIPDGLTDGTTYFWRVTTTDAEGNVTQSPVWSFELGGRFRYELLPGWNLVSVPFEPDAYSARQMMVSRKPFTLDNDGYVKANALEAGRAYWIFQRSLENRYGDLLSLGTRTQQSMELHNGWNLVGATETDAILDDTCTVWRFTEGVWQLLEPDDDGHYRLEAGQGYFIYQPAEEEP